MMGKNESFSGGIVAIFRCLNLADTDTYGGISDLADEVICSGKGVVGVEVLGRCLAAGGIDVDGDRVRAIWACGRFQC